MTLVSHCLQLFSTNFVWTATQQHMSAPSVFEKIGLSQNLALTLEHSIAAHRVDNVLTYHCSLAVVVIVGVVVIVVVVVVVGIVVVVDFVGFAIHVLYCFYFQLPFV